jgi:UDP-glucuronate 4-epimerase
VFNIGNNDPLPLMGFIEAIEQALGKAAEKNFLPLQDGDVPATYADVSELAAWTGFKPATAVRDGVARFVDWYRCYYRV